MDNSVPYKRSEQDRYAPMVSPNGSGGQGSFLHPVDQTYTTVNVVADRSLPDPTTVSLAELGQIVGTLIADLKTAGIIK